MRQNHGGHVSTPVTVCKDTTVSMVERDDVKFCGTAVRTNVCRSNRHVHTHNLRKAGRGQHGETALHTEVLRTWLEHAPVFCASWGNRTLFFLITSCTTTFCPSVFLWHLVTHVNSGQMLSGSASRFVFFSLLSWNTMLLIVKGSGGVRWCHMARVHVQLIKVYVAQRTHDPLQIVHAPPVSRCVGELKETLWSTIHPLLWCTQKGV